MKSREFLRKSKKKQENIERNSSISSIDPASAARKTCQNSSVDAAGYSNVSSQQAECFFFYNPTTVALEN
jgi:hypothetical protein